MTVYPQIATPKRTHRRVWEIVIGCAVAVALIVGGLLVLPPVVAAASQAAYNTAQAKAQAAVPAAPVGDATTADEQTTLDQSDAAGGQAIATERAAEALAAQQAAQQAEQIAAEAAQRAAATADVYKCPAGTVAGAVSATGEESNCEPENGNGDTCQAYNDANQCTAWGKP